MAGRLRRCAPRWTSPPATSECCCTGPARQYGQRCTPAVTTWYRPDLAPLGVRSGMHLAVGTRENQPLLAIVEANQEGRLTVRSAHLQDVTHAVGTADNPAVHAQPITDTRSHDGPPRWLMNRLSRYQVPTLGPLVVELNHPQGHAWPARDTPRTDARHTEREGATRGGGAGGDDVGVHTGRAALRIGPYRVDPPVVLAPMAGITNVAFRRLCREQGAGLFVCEMITSRALIERHPGTLKMISFDAAERPRSMQLYGVDPATIRKAVEMVRDEDLADHIDLNFGCPVPKVTRRGGGAALPYKRALFGQIVRGGCLGRPWLFAELQATFAGTPPPTPPNLGQVATIMRRHAGLLAEHLGADKSLRDLRKHISWYLHGFPVGGDVRRALGMVSSFAELDCPLARLDADAPFPAGADGPRGRQGSPGRVALPQGWLDDPLDLAVPADAELPYSGG